MRPSPDLASRIPHQHPRPSSDAPYLIGCDLGTSAMKAVLSDVEGNVICQASRQVDILRLDDQRVELDPERYVQEVYSLIGELTAKVDDPSEVKAISLSGASGNTLLLDGDYKPLGNAISWLDTRTAGKEAELWPDLDPERVYRSAGWPFGGTFPLAHLGWLKKYAADSWQQAHHFTMLHDYVYYRLCGRLVVDHSKATTFYLQDQETLTWNQELLDFLGLQEDQLSELLPPGTVCGTVTHEAAEASGLASGTKVVTGSFDHPSSARSTGVHEEGDLLISAGTSWVVFSPVRSRDAGLRGNMLIDPFLAPAGCWGAIFALTAVAEKMNDYLENCIASDNGEPLFERFDRLAAEASPGADGLFIELFTQPYEESRGHLQNAAPRNIARALMEGIVFLTRNRVDEVVHLNGGGPGRIVLTGGPTNSPIWPSILADVLNSAVVIPETGEQAGAMGAAILAGIGCGIFRSAGEGYTMTRPRERIVQPDPGRSKLYQKIYRDYVAQFNLTD